jgi:phage FluMu protein Com
VDLKDVRRLAATAMVLSVAVVVWLVLLHLQREDLFHWGSTEKALARLAFDTWMWLGVGTILVFAGVVAGTVFGVPAGKTGAASAAVRQVQCQDCKAVFFIEDTGRRPLSHRCPSCKTIGVYDGRAPPVGTLPRPEPAKSLVELSLTCRRCSHAFNVTDTGIRPLQVTCPSCKAVGAVS